MWGVLGWGWVGGTWERGGGEDDDGGDGGDDDDVIVTMTMAMTLMTMTTMWS